MTTARRTVEDPNGDITVLVDSVDLGDGAGDAPYVKLLGGSESDTTQIAATLSGALVVADENFGTPGVLADNTANPTLTAVETFPMVYDGSTWDRARGDSTDGLLVNLGANNDVRFNRLRTSALVPTVDTAVYADLDRLGSVVTVSNAAIANGGSGMIVGAWLQDDAGSNFGIEAFFFQVTPTLANADNGIWSLTDANIATALPVGKIDFLATSSTTYTDGRFTPGLYLGGPPALHYTCASGDTALYMSLRARGAYDAVATDDLNLWLELLRYS